MLPISNDYLNKIFAGRRKIKGMVEIQWTNEIIDNSISVSASNENRISFKEQIINENHLALKKWFSLDNTNKLDGTFSLMPSTNETYEVGWWSKNISDENGYFEEPPIISLSFLERPLINIKVVGDTVRQEYPINFEILAYRNEELIYSELIENNTNISFQKVLSKNVKNATKLSIKIYKWSTAFTVSKITKVNSQIKTIFTDDDLLYISLIEESEVSNASLPIGNISSNELSIRINNISNNYHPANVNSAIYGLIKKNRKIKAWIGLELDSKTTEYILLGTFWSGDWNVSEDNTYVETTCRDLLDLMTDTTFSTSEIIYDTNLYVLAEIVLKNYGLTENDYIIDSSLTNFSIPYGWFSETTHREALRKIASAAICRVFVTRQGKIKIEKIGVE